MNKAIVFLSASCAVGAAVACSSGDSGTTPPTDSGTDHTATEGGSSSGGSSSSGSSSGASSSGAMDAGGGVTCTGPSSCSADQICCGMANMTTLCQPKAMACMFQLCVTDSDCVTAGTTCQMFMGLPVMLCLQGTPRDAGPRDSGGDAGEGGGSSSSGGDGGDGGGDSAPQDAAGDGG
jgi:hypothetical protein